MKHIFIIALLLVTGFSFGQYNDVVILKNSSQIRGKLITTLDGTYRIKTRDGSLHVFQNSEVERVDSYTPKMSDKGFYFRPSISVAAGENTGLCLHLVNGYQFNKRFDVGFGIGIENLWDAYIPFFLEGRFYLNPDSRNKFFVHGMSGYEMPFSNWDQDKGGYTCGGAFGLQHNLSDRLAFATQVGYRYAYLKRENWWGDSVIENNINRIEIKVALNFK